MVGAVAEAFQVKWALAKVTVFVGRQSSKSTVGVWGLGTADHRSGFRH